MCSFQTSYFLILFEVFLLTSIHSNALNTAWYQSIFKIATIPCCLSQVLQRIHPDMTESLYYQTDMTESLYYQTCTLETFKYGTNIQRGYWKEATQIHPGTNNRDKSFGEVKLVENSRQTFLGWKPYRQPHAVPKRNLPNWISIDCRVWPNEDICSQCKQDVARSLHHCFLDDNFGK